MAWVYLIAAGALEVVWALALKQAAGLTRLWPTALAVVAATASLGLLTMALRSLPVGTAYAVWVGIGSVGVAAFGIAALGESASPVRLGCLGLIALGTVGLQLIER